MFIFKLEIAIIIYIQFKICMIDYRNTVHYSFFF